MRRNKTFRILVVDDNSDQARSLAMLLEHVGFEAKACDYSRDCMALIEQDRPDAVLVDLVMPNMTGFDIADEIQRNPDLRPACLIAVTGHAMDPEKTKSSGFDYHLSKPVDLQELQTILATVQQGQA